MGTKNVTLPCCATIQTFPPTCAKTAVTDEGSTSLNPTLKDYENELLIPVRIKRARPPQYAEPNKSQRTKQYRFRKAARGSRSQEALSIMLSNMATPPLLWHSLGWIWTNLSTIQQSLVFILAYPCDLDQRKESNCTDITAFLTHWCWS